MNDHYKRILDHLPYQSSFRFVDEISFVDDERTVGRYTLRKDSFFYEDHFKGYPVTPGAIVIEIMAQIGLVVPGIHHLLQTSAVSAGANTIYPLLTSTEVEFHKMVLPGETLEVHSTRKYFRLGKLKCYVEVFNESQALIARGYLAGMLKINES